MTTAAPRKLPADLNTNRMLDRWLRVDADGTVTVLPGKIEIGQGLLTALTQIVAEELEIAIARVRLAPATTAYSPNEGITSGSRSIEECGIALRYAAAEARNLLLSRAAARLGVTLEQLTVTDGVISARSGGSVTYWELTDADLLKREATADAPPRPASGHTVVGSSVARHDIPNKVTGVPTYVQDMELPDMLHGRIVRPPSPGARLAAMDIDEVLA
ncbi:MAG TPA: molybdopterin cofactor-binding domain-containing protein, partial [Burkholderiales bacterium]|nr:molybdopterin cofactor-binding domain-containing protein [Burkholderiales bacterium]